MIESVGDMLKGCQIPSWENNEGRKMAQVIKQSPAILFPCYASVGYVAGANRGFILLNIKG